MKKSLSKSGAGHRVDADEILPEYDFSRATPTKYASQYASGSAVVVVEPDVAAAFPSSGEANGALRALWSDGNDKRYPNELKEYRLLPPARLRIPANGSDT